MSRINAALTRIAPRHVLIVAGVTILTLVLTVVLRNAVRQLVVIPLSALVWAAGIFINSVSQAVWLSVLVLVGAIIVVRSLSRGTGAKPPDDTHIERQVATPTRLAFWVGRLSDARRSAYTTERALIEMRALVVDCIAHDQRVPAEDVIDLARTNALDVPGDVRALLLEDFAAQPQRTSRLRNFVDVLLARLIGHATTHDASLTPEFQRKINTMLAYVEETNQI